jgi:hypothetical protein
MWFPSAAGRANGRSLPTEDSLRSGSKDGKDLYYIDSTYNLFAVPVEDAGGALQFGAAQTLVANWTAPNVFYDVALGGKKILLDRVSHQVSQAVIVVTNFTAGLRK